MKQTSSPPKILILCATSTGLDAIIEVLRRGYSIQAIVGIHPDKADPIAISGWIDVAKFAQYWQIPFRYIERYDLKSEKDRETLEALEFDLIWIASWQRLIPAWLIERARLGALGGHGSPDGIAGGRGRSPQNWAIMLGCESFDMSLFRITPGVDDGPVIATRTFSYTVHDDIRASYQKAALAMGAMMSELLADPPMLDRAEPQSGTPFYYPQRRPEDGWVDWHLSCDEVWAHCRALSHPYPGLRAAAGECEIAIWECRPFDSDTTSAPGTITACFDEGDFLVSCGDGRLSVRKWSNIDGRWQPKPAHTLGGKNFLQTLANICERHQIRYPEHPISERILARLTQPRLKGK